MILGISGIAGSGKDAAADFLVKNHGFVKVALADPLKRICRDVFQFSDEQLWGPSSKRNEPDLRYPGEPFVAPEGSDAHSFQGYLTPRYALQQLGTEWGRHCYEDVWVEYALRIASALSHIGPLAHQHIHYSQKTGETHPCYSPKCVPAGTVIPDTRFVNEIEAIKKAGGKVVRIKREGAGLKGSVADHASEAEQLTIPDEAFDHVLDNGNGPLSALENKVSEMVKCLA